MCRSECCLCNAERDVLKICKGAIMARQHLRNQLDHIIVHQCSLTVRMALTPAGCPPCVLGMVCCNYSRPILFMLLDTGDMLAG